MMADHHDGLERQIQFLTWWYISYIHAWDAMNSMIPANSELTRGKKTTESKMDSQLLVQTAPCLPIENDTYEHAL